jgi:hypothetical protein
MAEYKDYTNDEYDALDEYYTKNTIMPTGGKPGVFARQKMKREAGLGQLTVTLTMDASLISRLTSMAEEAHETPAEVVAEMVRHEMAYA